MRRKTTGRPTDASRNSPLGQAGTILQELIWSTRCAVCDTPDHLLCAACAEALPFIDLWQACPRCGAPYGRLICTECNHRMLKARNRRTLPYARCTSAVAHNDKVRRIVTIFKDGGERRLAPLIAGFAAATLSPAIAQTQTVLTFIPASRQAYRRRGFDHTEETALCLAEILQLPLARIFERPQGRDQRGLSRTERQANMTGQLKIRPSWIDRLPQRILIYDDVYTTGATLFAASDALHAGGCPAISCVTFSRVWEIPDRRETIQR